MRFFGYFIYQHWVIEKKSLQCGVTQTFFSRTHIRNKQYSIFQAVT